MTNELMYAVKIMIFGIARDAECVTFCCWIELKGKKEWKETKKNYFIQFLPGTPYNKQQSSLRRCLWMRFKVKLRSSLFACISLTHIYNIHYNFHFHFHTFSTSFQIRIFSFRRQQNAKSFLVYRVQDAIELKFMVLSIC